MGGATRGMGVAMGVAKPNQRIEPSPINRTKMNQPIYNGDR